MNTMELEINGKTYAFKFGMGFLLEINKTYEVETVGTKNKEKAGLAFNVSGILDKNPEALLTILEIANKTETPRISKNEIMSYIESEDTDIDGLFAEVLDFLSKANCTKNMTLKIQKAAKVAEEEEKALKQRQKELMRMLSQ